MGNCTSHNKSNPSSSYKSSVKIQIPDVVYIDRKSKVLYSLKSTNSFQLQLKKKVRIYRDSCISILEDSSVIIAGGSDSSGSLTSWVHHINLSDLSLRKYPNLPIPCKYGTFLSTPSYFYYVGGICSSLDPDSSCEEEGAPLCRLSKGTMKWEMFVCKPDFNPSKFLQRKIFTDEKTERLSVYAPSGVRLKDLHEPGAVLFENRIFLFGGKILKKTFTPTNKIFSICLNETSFGINEENVSLPIALISPSCTIKKDLAIIAGGYLEDMSQNLEVFLVDCSQGLIRKFDLPFDRPIEPHFPIVTDGKGIACVSPPKLLYIREDKKNVFHFNLPNTVKIEKFQSLAHETTNNSEPFKKLVNLRINFIVDEKDQSKEEMMSLNEQIVVVNQSKHSENPFEEGEELKILVTSHSETPVKKEKIVRCECGSNIATGLLNDLSFKCGHCGKNQIKIYQCEECSKILCKSCSKDLQIFKPLICPSLKCKENHYFCSKKDESTIDSKEICTNCLNPQSKLSLFCFVCKIFLCQDCEFLIQSQTSPVSLKCSIDHQLKWVLFSSTSTPSSTCDSCLSSLKQIGYFYCLPCRFSLCSPCVKYRMDTTPENKYFFKANSFQERPKRLSDTLYKNEFNHGDEPKVTPSKSSKNKMNFSNFLAKVHKLDIIDSDAGNETPTRAKFETSFQDIKKKVIPRPVRSANPPLFSLSPRKQPVFIRDSNGSPAMVEIENKNLKNSSESPKESSSEEPGRLFWNDFNVKLHKPEMGHLFPKVPDTHENISSVKVSEFLKTSEKEMNTSECLNPLEMQDASFVCHNQSFNGVSESNSKVVSLQQVPSAIKNMNLTPRDSSLKSLAFEMPREPSIGFSVYEDSSDVFIAPDIRGTLAAGKLTALKAKLNLLTCNADAFSSTSENESFQEVVFRNFKEPTVSQGSSSMMGASQSLSKRESKRYTIQSESFSKDSEKGEKDDKKSKKQVKESYSEQTSNNEENESQSSGYEDFEILYD